MIKSTLAHSPLRCLVSCKVPFPPAAKTPAHYTPFLQSYSHVIIFDGMQDHGFSATQISSYIPVPFVLFRCRTSISSAYVHVSQTQSSQDMHRDVRESPTDSPLMHAFTPRRFCFHFPFELCPFRPAFREVVGQVGSTTSASHIRVEHRRYNRYGFVSSTAEIAKVMGDFL